VSKDWRGILPLHSTREDVEKLLGPPPDPPINGPRFYTLSKARSIYYLDEGEVYIVYLDDSILGAVDCLGKIPDGTVLMIQLTLKKEVKLRDFPLRVKGFRRFDPSEPKNIGYKGYLDEKSGIIIRSFKGSVDAIWYIAAAKDKHLCANYYENPKSFAGLLIGWMPSSDPRITKPCS